MVVAFTAEISLRCFSALGRAARFSMAANYSVRATGSVLRLPTCRLIHVARIHRRRSWSLAGFTASAVASRTSEVAYRNRSFSPGALVPINPQVTIRQVVWLVPVFVAIHNLEEGLTLPSWLAANLDAVRRIVPAAIVDHMPIDLAVGISRPHVYVALLIATLIPLGITAVVLLARKGRLSLYAVLMLQAVVGINAVFPHILATILLARYTPGVITAACINLPFSWYVFRRGVRERAIERKAVVLMLIAAAILYGPAVGGIHALSAYLVRAAS
jgi:hypothetical protein